MANPAQILHGLFKKWGVDSSAARARGLETNDADKLRASIQQLRFAALQLHCIEELLCSMRSNGIDTSKWEDPLDRWTKGLFLYPNGWGNTQQHSLDNRDIEMLSMLGDILQYQVPTLKEDGAKEVLEFIERIEETISGQEVNQHLSRHFANLFSHIRWCINNFDLVGEFELEKALQQLAASVSLQVHEDEQEGSGTSKLRVFMDSWIQPFTVGALAGYTGNLLSSSTLAITQ